MGVGLVCRRGTLWLVKGEKGRFGASFDSGSSLGNPDCQSISQSPPRAGCSVRGLTRHSIWEMSARPREGDETCLLCAAEGWAPGYSRV